LLWKLVNLLQPVHADCFPAAIGFDINQMKLGEAKPLMQHELITV